MHSYCRKRNYLEETDNKSCPSDERPEILADYFEHTQWAINNDRDRETCTEIFPPNLGVRGRRSAASDQQIKEQEITRPRRYTSKCFQTRGWFGIGDRLRHIK